MIAKVKVLKNNVKTFVNKIFRAVKLDFEMLQKKN